MAARVSVSGHLQSRRAKHLGIIEKHNSGLMPAIKWHDVWVAQFLRSPREALQHSNLHCCATTQHKPSFKCSAAGACQDQAVTSSWLPGSISRGVSCQLATSSWTLLRGITGRSPRRSQKSPAGNQHNNPTSSDSQNTTTDRGIKVYLASSDIDPISHPA